jgi:hypothetical protein
MLVGIFGHYDIATKEHLSVRRSCSAGWTGKPEMLMDCIESRCFQVETHIYIKEFVWAHRRSCSDAVAGNAWFGDCVVETEHLRGSLLDVGEMRFSRANCA